MKFACTLGIIGAAILALLKVYFISSLAMEGLYRYTPFYEIASDISEVIAPIALITFIVHFKKHYNGR
jgi:hypothetical protein